MTPLFPILQPEHIETEHWNDFNRKYGPDLLGDSPIQQPPSYLQRQGRFLMSLITLCFFRGQSTNSDIASAKEVSQHPPRQSSSRHLQPRQSSSRHLQAWGSTSAIASSSAGHESRILL